MKLIQRILKLFGYQNNIIKNQIFEVFDVSLITYMYDRYKRCEVGIKNKVYSFGFCFHFTEFEICWHNDKMRMNIVKLANIFLKSIAKDGEYAVLKNGFIFIHTDGISNAESNYNIRLQFLKWMLDKTKES